MGASEMGTRVITTAAIDVHLPDNPSYVSSAMLGVDAPGPPPRVGMSVSDTSVAASHSAGVSSTRGQSVSSHTLSSSTDCSTAHETSYRPLVGSGGQRNPLLLCSSVPPGQELPSRGPQDHSAVVQELLSSLTGDSCLAQKGLDPVNLKLPSPTGSTKTSPELEHRVNIYNKKNQESLSVFQTKPLIHLQANEPVLGEKYRLLDPANAPVTRLPDT
ncbi:hypothetical protein JZ751_020761 [Albula glossodonta]|uniref:Uncharacterized protein n=1 Tax=Albula glossodonta TaxID=121402 RepID=A0A8T2PNG0_9TELE|nr:hypothetical protein JZ751_020761 [Albula glossodonta]